MNEMHKFTQRSGLRPGEELVHYERSFKLWAYTISHGQLLFRSFSVSEGGEQSRIDLLFVSVFGVKIRPHYGSLSLRIAKQEERASLLSEFGQASQSAIAVALEFGSVCDYVLALTVEWLEDDGGDREPSRLAAFAPASDPGRTLS